MSVESGLSRRLQSLENWAGAALLNRRKSPIELTDAGAQLLATANDVIGRLNATRRALRKTRIKRRGACALPPLHLLSVTFFPKWLPQIQATIGSTRLTILSDNLPGCCDAFDDGAVDFVVCYMDQASQLSSAGGKTLSISRCQWLTIGREKLVPLSAVDGDKQPLHDLAPEPRWVDFLSRLQQRMLTRLGRRPEAH